MADKMIGYCKFCGQSRMVEEGAKDADMCATLHCSCEDARKYQRKMEQYEDAKNKIEYYVGKETPLSILLLDAVKSLQEQTALKYTVKLTKNTKIELTMKSDGEIKVAHEAKYRDEVCV